MAAMRGRAETAGVAMVVLATALWAPVGCAVVLVAVIGQNLCGGGVNGGDDGG